MAGPECPPRIGIVALQGGFEAHAQAVLEAGGEPFLVRTPAELDGAQGILLPGGESTTIGKLMVRYGLDTAIVQAHRRGIPVYGSCAGMILMAQRITSGAMHGGQPTLGLMDIGVARNAFGRQVDSFEADIVAAPEITREEDGVAGGPVRAVFIRAPYITDSGPDVVILARYDGQAVLARQGSLLVSSFHPELTADRRVHAYFLRLAVDRVASRLPHARCG